MMAGRASAKPPRATALQHAVKLLSARPYSAAKLREKLLLRGYPAPESDAAIRRLIAERLLDDRRFAEDFVRARIAAMPRSGGILSRELRQRGVSPAIAKEVVAALAPPDNDESLARELLRRKAKAYAGLDDLARKRRLSAFLARRGFSYATIRRVLGGLPADD